MSTITFYKGNRVELYCYEIPHGNVCVTAELEVNGHKVRAFSVVRAGIPVTPNFYQKLEDEVFHDAIRLNL